MTASDRLLALLERSRVGRRIEGLPFRRKLGLLSRLAAAAIGAVIALNVISGIANGAQLTRVRGAHEAVESARDLEERIRAMSEVFRFVAASHDPSVLGAADTLSREMVTDLEVIRVNATSAPALLDSAARATQVYYTLGRWSAERLAANVSSDSLVHALDQVAAARRTLGLSLPQLRAQSTRDADRAASAASRGVWIGWAASLAIALLALALLLAVLELVVSSVVRPVIATARAADHVSRGELAELRNVSGDDEMAMLQRAMQSMTAYLAEMSVTARAIAAGDLTVTVRPRSANDAFGNAFGEMTTYLRRMAATAEDIARGDLTTAAEPASDRDLFGQAFHTMSARLSSVISEIHGGAAAITSATDHLTGAASRLSENVANEAARLERTQQQLGQVNALIRANADASQQAGELAARSAADASVSGDAVQASLAVLVRVTRSVESIQELSSEINLLALNAAIEAARVGTHGLGFAVVAEGMRELADASGSSARTAQQTTDEGRETAARAGTLVARLVPAIQETATLVQRVTDASAAQARGVAEVTIDMHEVTALTAGNAEGAEQLAATSQELAAQAEGLRELVRFFKLRPDQLSGVPQHA